jgi:serine/threonine-protein kinase
LGLEHPNAVRIISTGVTSDKLPYVAMEFVEGRTLSRIIQDEGPMTAVEVADWLAQVADLLDAAHAKSIVHRDIKPGNIMLCRNAAGRLTVKVLDFGFAKALDADEDGGAAATQAGVAVGTPAFMSPEQVAGAPVTPQSDIYSLGVTLFAALTGHPPFEESNPVHTMMAHVRSGIPRFSDKHPGNAVPASIEAVVRRALAKAPADRPATAGELARLFQEALTNPQARPPERDTVAPSSAPTSASAGSTAAWAVAIVLVVVAVIGGWWVWFHD